MKKTTALKTGLTTALMIASLLAAASSAYAGHKGHRDNRSASDAVTDFAKVTHVEPIYKTVAHRTPERQCWTETVAYEQPHNGYRSHTGTILGGLIGGAIGNELGHHKSNQQVGAVAGAILGASVARDIGNKSNPHYSSTEYREEERCEVTHQVSYEEKITGYKVTYRYHGNLYHTRMDHHPGKKIKVAVNVSPVY